MSSHHIVRDKQEPALLIIDMKDFHEEYLGQLLEWSPTVIVASAEYEKVNSLGIKIDAVISPSAISGIQESTLLIPEDGDPLQSGLKFLVGEQYPSVNVIDRQFCAKDYALYVGRISLVVLTPTQRIFPVQSGFGKWKAGAETIEILQEVKNLKTSGLVKDAEHRYHTMKDGFYTLEFDQAFTFIAEAL